MSDLNEYELERRSKRDKLRELGVDPYGHAETGLLPLADIRASYTAEMGHDGGPVVKVAGRIVLKRDMGKLSFITLRDQSGDLQVALDKKRLTDGDWAVAGLLDLADQIVVEGPLGTTKKGETTVWATALRPASKSVLPPPGKWDGLSDVELRYRQRYVDLWANPDVMRQMKLRFAVVAEIRAYLTRLGYVEVETPMMQPMAGGAAARPFVTHHNALDIPLYLRIAPELYLKRLLVGGFTKVFELNRNFRNEGVSPRHNPEFTMLELYEAFGSWRTMADLVEGMICHLAQTLFGGLKIEHKNGAGEVTRTIHLQQPWRRVTMVDLVEERTGWRFDGRPLHEADPDLFGAMISENADQLRQEIAEMIADPAKLTEVANDVVDERFTTVAGTPIPVLARQAIARIAAPALLAQSRQIDVGSTAAEVLRGKSPAEQLVEVYEKLIEPTLIDPCFVTQVPSVIIPLAKKNPDDPFFADVYELAINGQEISPGYTELNDPDVQAANFAEQVGDDAEKHKVDDDFLTALKYGMPPAGGLGLGVDRLVMLLTGAASIRDVVLFPLMRPGN